MTSKLPDSVLGVIRGALVLGAGWLLGIGVAPAWGAELVVVPVEGSLHEGSPSPVVAAWVDDLGAPLAEVPPVTVSGATVRYSGARSPGVAVLSVLPAAGATEVVFRVGDLAVKVPVARRPSSRLEVPARILGRAGDPLVRFTVSGPDLPPPQALQVVVGDGVVESVNAVAGGLEVTVRVPDSPYPKVLPVGVRDLRRPERPSWGKLVLQARVRLPLQIDPGIQATFTVGERSYGPLVADSSGQVLGIVDQWPGESQAEVKLVDDLGNETRTTLPLSVHSQPTLAGAVSGPIAPGTPAPTAELYVMEPDGSPWTGAAPRCRTPIGAEPTLVALGKGLYSVVLAPTGAPPLQDQRVVCAVAGGETQLRWRVADHWPTRLSLRVFPDQLSSDLPEAEIGAVVEDARAERLAVDGISIVAERGAVSMDQSTGAVARGSYDGRQAVERGQDRLVARYRAPFSEGPVQFVEVAWDGLVQGLELQLYGRALDVSGRPVKGAELRLAAGSFGIAAVTGTDGWASARVPIPAGKGPVVVEAATETRKDRDLALRGRPGPGRSSATELMDSQEVTISAGVVKDISVQPSPPILYLGQRAAAFVTVTLRDRAGAPVIDEPIELSASEGTVGEPVAQADGTWLATFTPAPGEQSRVVEITAKVPSNGLVARGQIELQPSPVNGAIGVVLGASTNFGQIRPAWAIGADLRTPLLGGAVMVRFGVGQFWDSASVATGVGDPLQVSTQVFPIRAGMLLRRDGKGLAGWVGLTGVLAPYWVQARSGETLVASGVGVLPGFALHGGGGVRLGFGEVVFEIEGLALPSPRGNLRYEGIIGGLAVGLGYRVVY